VRRHPGVDEAGDSFDPQKAGLWLRWCPRHGVELNVEELFYAHVRLHGGPAPVRRFLPELIDLVLKGKINPGKVFD